MTRAMSKLYMTYAEKRAFAGIGGVNRPSRFISEIPSDCMEAINLNFYNPLESQVVVRPINRLIKDSSLPFSIGQRVRHARFGEGMVVSGEGNGEAARVHVNFDSVGAKWLVLSYAKLEPVG